MNTENGRVIWITGLSGAGKTSVAKVLYQYLQARGMQPILLDGDILRRIFNLHEKVNDSYNRESRLILSKKYSLLCEELSSQGFIVIIATISMYKEIYEWNRKKLPNYFEVFLNVPFSELRRRDPKNIYKDFSSGKIRNVAGLDLKIENPSRADLRIDYKDGNSCKKIADLIMKNIMKE